MKGLVKMNVFVFWSLYALETRRAIGETKEPRSATVSVRVQQRLCLVERRLIPTTEDPLSLCLSVSTPRPDTDRHPTRRRRFPLFLLSTDTVCCSEGASCSCVSVSWAAESLVSLNYRYKHNYFLEEKKAQTTAMFTSDRKSVCFVCLSTAVFLWLKLYSVNTYYCLL